jgi:acetamidase/formamidase
MKMTSKKGTTANVPKKNKNVSAEAVAETVETVETQETVSAETEEIAEASPEETEALEAAEKEAAAPVVAAVAAKKVTVPVAVSPKKPGDYVNFACVREISPPPIIGSFKVADELNITKMSVGGRYALPRYVAEVLVDAGAGMIG